MNYDVYFVDSLENIDPTLFAGDFFVTRDGELYEAQASDQLGGIGSFFKSLGKVALNVGGGIVGVSGLGNSLLGSSGSGGSQATNDAAIAQIRGEIEKVVNGVRDWQLDEAGGHAAIKNLYQSWDAWKMAQSSKDKNYLYFTGDLQVLKWTDATAQIAEYGKRPASQNPATATASAAAATAANGAAANGFMGFTPVHIGVGALVLIFLMRR